LVTVAEIRRSLTTLLRDGAIDNAAFEADLLLCHELGWKRDRLFLNSEYSLSSHQAERLIALARRRANREPLAYVLGEWEFWGMPLAVGPGCLVPRPETEFLVEVALSCFEEGLFLDWGTGSGCIAAAIATERPSARGIAVDVSSRALAFARQNLLRYGLIDRIALCCESDPLHLQLDDASLELIVSNPPYIPTGKLKGLMPEVSLYEPKEALDGGEDGLVAYRPLLRASSRFLRRGGFLVVEVGDKEQADALREIGAGVLEFVDCMSDYGGIPRVCLWRKADL
jgi:release factor glutamine methyltransferase